MKYIIVSFHIFQSSHLQRQSLKGGCGCHKDREKGRSEKSLVQHHLGQSSLRAGELDDPLEDEIPGPDTGADQTGSQDEESAHPHCLEVGSFFLNNDLSENISNIDPPVSLPPPTWAITSPAAQRTPVCNI